MHMRRSTPLAFALFSLSLKEAAGHTCTFASTVHNSCLKAWGGECLRKCWLSWCLAFEAFISVTWALYHSFFPEFAQVQTYNHPFFFLGLGSWPTHHNTPQSLYVMSRSGHKMPGVARVSRKVQTFTQCAFSHSWFFFSLSLFVVPRLHFQALVLCVCVFVAASVRYFSSDGCMRDALVESSRGIVHFIAPSVG